MEIKSHFSNIRQIIINNLLTSNTEIYVAVAWFTNHDIFNILLEKAKHMPTNIIILNDDINNRIDGLNFQKFIDNGGKFYFGRQKTPMHNKFCIIDKKILITGSYNYTYLAESTNSENVLVLKGTSDIIESYRSEFSNMVSNLEPIKSVSEYLNLNPYQKNLFSYKSYGIKDIYEHTQQMKNEGLINDAKLIIKEVEDYSKFSNSNNFQINDVIYKQWKQDYYTEKIQVLDNNLILYYRTINNAQGCWLHGPKTIYAWCLRNSNNHNLTCKASRITNIKINGQKLVTSTENEEIFYFSKKDEDYSSTDFGYKLNQKKKPIKENGVIIPVKVFKAPDGSFELTCEIHFNIKDFPLETVDLIEGLGTDERENHWHCFDINLKLNREKL